MTETQERFLRAVADRLPADRVVEVHLFPSLRQGQVESGVAIFAVEPEPPPAARHEPEGGMGDTGDAGDTGDTGDTGDGAHASSLPASTADDESAPPAAEAGGGAVVETEARDGAAALNAATDPTPPADDAPCDPTDDAAGPPPSDAGAAPPDAPPAGAPAEPEAAGATALPATPHAAPPTTNRHTIVTAHYRLTIKGPDRGKWELGVVADADAPLITLEAVVRGVRHRASEGSDAERLSGDEFRAAAAMAGGVVARR